MTDGKAIENNIKRLADHLPKPLLHILRRIWVYVQGYILWVLTGVGYIPSHSLRRFFYRHLFGIKLGRGSIIHWQARFFSPWRICIGEFCNLGNNIFLDGRKGLTIGNCVATGSEVMIYTLQHDIDSRDFAAVGAPVVIGDYVYLGPRVIVLPGVTIGKGAVVAAGGVVTGDVAPYTVVGGVPARFLRERSHDLDYRPDFAMPFQ